MFKVIFLILISLFNICISLNANSMDFIKSIDAYELKDNNITKNIDIKTIKSSFLLVPNSKLFIKLNLKNSFDRRVEKILYFNSAVAEIKVYKDSNFTKSIRSIDYSPYAYFKLILEPKSTKSYYIQVLSKYIPVKLKLFLEDSSTFYLNIDKKLVIQSALLGVLIIIFLIFVSLYLIDKDRSYIYFALFTLFYILIYFYMSGLEKLFVTNRFIELDNSLIIIKFNIMFIAFSLFILSFFNISKGSKLYVYYILISYISAIGIIVAGFFNFYYISLTILIALLIINYIVIYLYLRKKNYETLLFLVANLILSTLLGLILFEKKILYNLDYLLFLSYILICIMYVYRYVMYKIKYKKLIATGLDTKIILENKIESVKKELTLLLKSKNSLEKSINTIIKDNLNRILSILRINSNSNIVSNEIEKLNRKITIYTKVFTLIESNSDNVDMNILIKELVRFIQNLYKESPKKLRITTKVDAKLSANEALDMAYRIAQLLISSYEDYKDLNNDKIEITIKSKNRKNYLTIKDLTNQSGILSKIKTFLATKIIAI